jgi:hypothetical protein
MTRWTASIVAISLASFPSVVNAQADCNAVPAGPARTDCYLRQSQIYSAQSALAAAKARAIGEKVEITHYRTDRADRASSSKHAHDVLHRDDRMNALT